MYNASDVRRIRGNGIVKTGSEQIIKTLALLLVVSYALFGIGCDSGSIGEGEDDPPPDTLKTLVCTTEPSLTELMPLEVGSYWKYFSYDFEGGVQDSVRVQVSPDWTDMLGRGGHRLFGLQEISDGDSDPKGAHLYYSDERGLVQAGIVSLDDTLLIDNVYRPFPSSLGVTAYKHRYGWNGSSWEVRDSLLQEVIALDKEFATPAGTFSTIVYRNYVPPCCPDVATGIWSDIYYAPGIGKVGIEYRSPASGELKGQLKMSSYCLMKPRVE
jgi:hypothetical protein